MKFPCKQFPQISLQFEVYQSVGHHHQRNADININQVWTRDAIKAYIQVTLKEAHKLLGLPKKECPETWISLPPSRRPAHWDNIEDDYKSQFKECERCDNQDTPYDYKSVMHYGSHAFSKNGRPTITVKNNEEIGQRNGFSYYDLVELNKIYSCPERKTMIINLNKTNN